MSEPKKPAVWSRNFIFVVLANLMLCLGHFSVNPHVPSYALHLGANEALMGFMAGMFFGVALAMRPVAGPVVTKFDKRKLLMIVFALGAVANAGYALFPYIPAFLAFRVINGVQYGFVGSLLMTLASDSLPAEKLTSGMGIYGIGGAVATAIAPTMAAAIQGLGRSIADDGMGYRLMFLCTCAIMVLAIAPTALIKSSELAGKARGSANRWYKDIFDKHTVALTVVAFLVTMAYALYNNYIIEFARERGIPNASVFYTALALILMVSRPLSGFLTDRFGIKRVLFPGIALLAASFVIVGYARSLPVLLIGAAVAAIGHGSSMPTLQAMSVQTVPPSRRGVASNTLYIGLDLGLFLGPVFGGFVLTLADFGTMLLLGAIPVAAAFAALLFALPRYFRRREELSAEPPEGD